MSETKRKLETMSMSNETVVKILTDDKSNIQLDKFVETIEIVETKKDIGIA